MNTWETVIEDWRDYDFMTLVVDAMARDEITLQDAVLIAELTGNTIF